MALQLSRPLALRSGLSVARWLVVLHSTCVSDDSCSACSKHIVPLCGTRAAISAALSKVLHHAM